MISLEYSVKNDVDVVKVIGRLGAADSAIVAAELINVIDNGNGTLHMDLSELEFIDSSGLSTLVSLLKHARKKQGDVILIDANDRVTALLELTRLHEIFDIRESVPIKKAS